MNSQLVNDNSHSSGKETGRNLLCEILTFWSVFAICTLGNLLIMILLSERFLIPLSAYIIDTSSPGDSTAIINAVLSLPCFPILILFSTTATIAVVILFCKLIQRRSWNSIGLSRKHAFSHYVRGYFFGGIAISVAVAVCVVTGAGSFVDFDHAPFSIIALFLIGYLIQGASEELLCRGYFMYSVARRYPMWIAVVSSSVLFALLHMPNNGVSINAFLNLFLFGVFTALLTLRTGSIWYASGFHSAWNFFQGNLYGIKVSGMDMHGSLLSFISNPSKTYLNGGDFGMEGGFLCTALLIVGIFILLRTAGRNVHTTDRKT